MFKINDDLSHKSGNTALPKLLFSVKGIGMCIGIGIVNIGPVYMVSNQYKNLHREVLKNKKK